jgi:TRAP transporter TAXI family solute receptor
MFRERVSVLIGLAAGLMLAVSGAQAQDVGIAASNPGSIYHTTATAVAKMVNDKAGLKATVHPFASPTIYLPAVDAGEYSFGLTNENEIQRAATGTGHFDGRVYGNLRAVALLYPLRVAFFVRTDSGIMSIADLKGKRVTTGFSSQKTIPDMLDAQLATAGLTQEDVTGVPVPNVVGAANAFMQGKADAFFFAIGSPKVREANAKVGGIRALNIENTPENLATLRKHFAPAYLRAEKPSKPNVGVLEPMHVMSYDAVLVASTNTPDDIVYRMAKGMHDHKKEMASIFPVLNLFSPNRMAKDLGAVKWHDGAVKLMKEKGVWPLN